MWHQLWCEAYMAIPSVALPSLLAAPLAALLLWQGAQSRQMDTLTDLKHTPTLDHLLTCRPPNSILAHVCGTSCGEKHVWPFPLWHSPHCSPHPLLLYSDTAKHSEQTSSSARAVPAAGCCPGIARRRPWWRWLLPLAPLELPRLPLPLPLGALPSPLRSASTTAPGAFCASSPLRRCRLVSAPLDWQLHASAAQYLPSLWH